MALLKLIAEGFRATAFVKVRAAAFDVSLLTVSLSILLGLIAKSASDWIAAGESHTFYMFGLLTAVALWALVAFVAACLFSWQRPRQVPAIIAGLAAAYVPAELARLAALFAADRWLESLPLDADLNPYVAWYLPTVTTYAVFVVIFAIAVFRSLSAIVGHSTLRIGAGVPIVCLLVWSILPSLPIIRGNDNWSEGGIWPMAERLAVAWSAGKLDGVPETDQEDYLATYDPNSDSEVILDRQPALRASALADLLPEQPGKADIYAVTFAGYASQAVFRREALSVKGILADRLGTFRRQVTLINNDETAASIPMASARNLEETLAQVGKIMNRDEDILFLYMTSHGAPVTFSVSYGDMPLRSLGPKRLKKMLDDAGIKNRVIVISACYSGSFIPGLADDHTLIITAASATQPSFGCSDENEWTYFGDAFFNHALKQTTDLAAAFGIAKKTVTEWETRDGFTPSDPQISVGKAIETRLKHRNASLAQVVPIRREQ